MKRNLIVAGILIFGLVIVGSTGTIVSAKGLQAEAKSSAGNTILKGKIVDFTDSIMIIRDEFGTDHNLTWDQDTVFVQKDQRIKSKDVKIGYPVELEATRHQGKLHIKRVRINEILQPYKKPAKTQEGEELQSLKEDSTLSSTDEVQEEIEQPVEESK